PPDRLLFIAELDGDAVGTVRFDLREPDVWEVSITLAPASRGRGLSGFVLAEGEQALLERVPAQAVLAAVHQDNRASNALFERAGYADTAPAVSGFRQLRKTLG